MCARVGQVLRKENAPPRVSAKFYKTIVKSVLLCGNKTWVLSKAVLARLEGFQIWAAFKLASKDTRASQGHAPTVDLSTIR